MRSSAVRPLPLQRRHLTCVNSTTGGSRKRKKDDKKGPGARPAPPGNPVVALLYDGTLILGDCVMVVATEVSSDRVPVAYMPLLAAVMAGTWVATAAAKGDYRYDAEAGEVDAWSAMMGLPVVKAITEASLTWAAASLAACAVFAALVSRGFMEGDLSEPLLEASSHKLAPQLEVLFATLPIMSSWRGIVAKLRMM